MKKKFKVDADIYCGCEIGYSVIERMNFDIENCKTFEDVIELLYQCIDDELIYVDDQWEIIEFYCTPQDADFDTAWEYLYDDVYRCIVEEFEEDVEEDEEYEDEESEV